MSEVALFDCCLREKTLLMPNMNVACQCEKLSTDYENQECEPLLV